MKNKWYFYESTSGKAEVLEIEKNENDSWYSVVGKTGYGKIDCLENKNKIFDTKRECLEYAINLVSTKRLQLQVLENALNAELVRTNIANGELWN